MSRHQKRLSAPDSWPVERKVETFTAKAGAGPHGEAGVPLSVLLRDVLGYVDSTKEARYALDQDSVLVNGDPVSDERRPIGMFDILAFTEREEFYRVFPGEGGRLALTPIDAGDADSKLGKVIGKQQVPGGETQLSLHDGATLVVDDAAEYGGGDSVVVSTDEPAVVAHFPYEEGALVTAVQGAHAGEIGHLDEIQVTPGSAPNSVLVSRDDGADFETIAEYVVVIDENFTVEEAADEATVGADVPAADAEDASAASTVEGDAAEEPTAAGDASTTGGGDAGDAGEEGDDE
jgi:small subunit ribosomal protein S4e